MNPGTIVGKKYKILRTIGYGGMATVYLAQHIETHQQYAIKVLDPKYYQDQNILQRFKREASIGKALHHKNIPIFHGFEFDKGLYYIVMEYVQGYNVRQYLKQYGVFSIKDAVFILNEVLQTLQFAYENGIQAHRDIKPENIMIDPATKTIKVMDFGVSRMEESTLTTETKIYTVKYASPEQLLPTRFPKGVTQQSDLYSLGIVFYEMITGKLPFEGTTQVDILEQELHFSITPPHEINSSIPAYISNTILKSLLPNPHHRYQTPEEMRQNLLSRNCQTPLPKNKSYGVQKRNNTMVYWLGGFLTLALFLGGIFAWGYASNITSSPIASIQTSAFEHEYINMDGPIPVEVDLLFTLSPLSDQYFHDNSNITFTDRIDLTRDFKTIYTQDSILFSNLDRKGEYTWTCSANGKTYEGTQDKLPIYITKMPTVELEHFKELGIPLDETNPKKIQVTLTSEVINALAEDSNPFSISWSPCEHRAFQEYKVVITREKLDRTTSSSLISLKTLEWKEKEPDNDTYVQLPQQSLSERHLDLPLTLFEQGYAYYIRIDVAYKNGNIQKNSTLLTITYSTPPPPPANPPPPPVDHSPPTSPPPKDPPTPPVDPSPPQTPSPPTPPPPRDPTPPSPPKDPSPPPKPPASEDKKLVLIAPKNGHVFSSPPEEIIFEWTCPKNWDCTLVVTSQDGLDLYNGYISKQYITNSPDSTAEYSFPLKKENRINVTSFERGEYTWMLVASHDSGTVSAESFFIIEERSYSLYWLFLQQCLSVIIFFGRLI